MKSTSPDAATRMRVFAEDIRSRLSKDGTRLVFVSGNFNVVHPRHLRLLNFAADCGDLIVDEYVTCDPLGMSQEDPTIVVTPTQRDPFVGRAGIIITDQLSAFNSAPRDVAGAGEVLRELRA